MQKVTFSFVMSVSVCLSFVCMSVCMNRLATIWQIFVKPEIWVFSKNLLRRFKFHSDLMRINFTLHEDICIVMIESCWIHCIERDVSGKSCRENQNTHYIFNKSPPPKSCWLWDSVEKCCRAGQAVDGNMACALCMLDEQGYKHTLKIWNTYFYSTAAVVAQMCLIALLYVHCLSCLSFV